jgi:t-SNARE complex subunit (syntaxin)
MNNQRRKKINKVIENLEVSKQEITSILDEEQECFDNIPEGLLDSERALNTENAIASLDEAIGQLDEAIVYLEEAKE